MTGARGCRQLHLSQYIPHIYLGVTVHNILKWTPFVDTLIKKIRDRFYQLSAVFGNDQLSRETRLKIYRTYIVPIFRYGMAVAFPEDAQSQKLERLQLKLLKTILGSSPRATTAAVLSDTRVRDVALVLDEVKLQFIGRVLCLPKERLVRSLMENALKQTKKGSYGWRIKERLRMYDLQDKFQCLVEGSITQDKWRQEVAAAFSAYHLHKLKESVNGAVKINDVVKTSVSHLYLNVAPKYASFLFRLRAGDLELAIETGRHKGLARGERTCPLCEGGEVEDAVHFCLRCPRLAAARHALFTAVEAVVEPWSVEFGRWCKSLGHSVTFKGESAETVLLRHLMGEPMEGMPREMQSVVISRMA